MNNTDKTIVMTGIVRLSFLNCWEPKSIQGGKPKYSASIIIPKSDTDTIAKIETTVEAAIQAGVGKFGGKIPPRGALKLPLRDGDTERDDEAYKDSMFVNANSVTQPGIVDAQVRPILERSEMYSGVYARVTLGFYAFNTNGNKGVACGLRNIQKIRDGEPLGGRVSAESEFTAFNDPFTAASGGDDFLA
ncbi:DUF2815 family protein [Schaalia sp. lx-100]|uniref:DUF2815 family protein n=1 Tax=Schaalia sp. lx-100 TaxID=2899081 RepID=UPI001E6073A0|nr:DUF2815 family protein [Schaalia sp. lx-100]MCD4557337.1 DUF2815 family protein [Schaalia sp. lx-100]